MIIDNNPVMMGQDEIIRLATELAEFIHFKPIRVVLLILFCVVVALLAL